MTFEFTLFPVYVVSHLLVLPLFPELPRHGPVLSLELVRDLANAGLETNGAAAVTTNTLVTAIANAIFAFMVSGLSKESINALQGIFC